MRNSSVHAGESHGCVLLRRSGLLGDDFSRLDVHLSGVGLAVLETGVPVVETHADLLDLEASEALVFQSELDGFALGLGLLVLVFPFEFRSAELCLVCSFVLGSAGFLFCP